MTVSVPYAIDFDLMSKELVSDEGDLAYAYQDSLGYWTIGSGILIDRRKGGQLYPEERAYILSNRIRLALQDIDQEPWYIACTSDTQKRGVLNMRYQLGPTGIRAFVQALALMSSGKFKEAGQELRASLWYKQTPARAERVIRQIEGTS